MNEIQKKIKDKFNCFGRTSLSDRLEDIEKECQELMRYTDVRNLKEETGDLLCSVIQLCTECGWQFENLVRETLEKIHRRRKDRSCNLWRII